MRGIFIFAVIMMATAATIDYHDTLDDYHDIESVVQDPVTRKEHLDCYIGKGPCSDLTESYRIHLPAAFREACARCNDGQKHMLRVWLDGLKKYSPEGYEAYADFYDPDRTKMAKMEAAIANY